LLHVLATLAVVPLIGRPRRRGANSLPRIDTLAQWNALRARPGHHNVARTETVKFAIDLQDDCRIYFINSAKWVTHYDFVLRFINPYADYSLFLIAEYKRDDRRFVLGSIMRYLDGDHWTLELDAGDTLDAARIAWTYRQVAPRLAVARGLRFRPVSPGQIALAEQLGGQLPSLSRDAINATIQYQPVVLGVAYGYLRLIHGSLDIAGVRPYDVVVVDQVPEAIPPVAGLVTGQLQAPLAHVAVLSRNRNTPDMALRGATDLHRFRELDGELVKLSVASQDYTLERAGRAEAEAAWETVRPRQVFRPESDLVTTGLRDVAALPYGAAHCVGAKAAQVRELYALPGIETAGGFVLPFSAYAAHLAAAGLDAVIEATLADRGFLDDAAARERQLSRLRAAIIAQPVEPALLAALEDKLRSLGSGGRYIFRSSTNAEDLAGFNGAGLYDSLIVPAQPTPGQIANSLRRVWASVWLQRAYEEREWFRIDHRAVAMAVLVQPFVDDAVATGVAITGNPFNAGGKGVFINSQVSGSTVTGAIGNVLPEQYLVATWAGEYEPELLCHSSLTHGETILAATDVTHLTDQLLRIHAAMLPTHAGSANAMDVEFAFMPDRRFVMLQARPYTIVYSLDRTRVRRHETIMDRLVHKARQIIYRVAGPPRLSAP
jgi:rifampicin phosphotransferase